MFSRPISFRALVVSCILGLALDLIPLATALAGAGGGTYP
jgi:hypothetical protein